MCEDSDEKRKARATDFMRLNRDKGAAAFGLMADNMTAILVYFDQQHAGGGPLAVQPPANARLVSNDDDEWI